MKRVVMYITARVEFECEDMSVQPNELFEDLDYNFEASSAGALVTDTELFEYEVVDN